jgi:hypothetical protein
MTHRRYRVYFLLFLFKVVCYRDRINRSVAGRSIAQEFVLSPVALGYLFSSFLWARLGALTLTRAVVSFVLTRHTLGEAVPAADGKARA